MELEQTELLYTLALLQVPGVGNNNARALLSRCGSAEAVFRSKTKVLESIPGIGPKVAAAVRQNIELKLAEQELNYILKQNINLLHYQQAAFPQRLKRCADYPLLLFMKGQAELNSQRMIAVVGTRKATPYGLGLSRQLILGLSALNVTIVSGLAYGIDISAHRAALEAGLPTLAVLGNGLGRIYPAAHKQVAEKMLEKGGLLTELWHETEPDKENFPKRNRIVAGMVDAVVVVEAAQNGGALITAELANGYNRDVFAFPGRVNDVSSAGAHQLIRQNKAALLTSADELMEALNWLPAQEEVKARQMQLFVELETEEQAVLDMLGLAPQLSVDQLCFQSDLALSRLASILLALEFKGLVRALPGKYYCRTT